MVHIGTVPPPEMTGGMESYQALSGPRLFEERLLSSGSLLCSIGETKGKNVTLTSYSSPVRAIPQPSGHRPVKLKNLPAARPVNLKNLFTVLLFLSREYSSRFQGMGFPIGFFSLVHTVVCFFKVFFKACVL